MKYHTQWNILDEKNPGGLPTPGQLVIVYHTRIDYSKNAEGEPIHRVEIITAPILPENGYNDCAIIWAYWPPVPDARNLPGGPDGTGNLCP